MSTIIHFRIYKYCKISLIVSQKSMQDSRTPVWIYLRKNLYFSVGTIPSCYVWSPSWPGKTLEHSYIEKSALKTISK